MESYSVLMSVYFKENPEYFKTAIDSMLTQTIKPSDFVIVCDGNLTEELDNVLDDYVNKYPKLFNIVRLKNNIGLGLALKAGLNECKCELVARMDTDDISLPDRMEIQLKAFEENPDATVIGGQISEFLNNPEEIIDYRFVPLKTEEIYKRAKSRNPMNHVTVVYKKSHLLEVGSYENLPGFEDYRLWVTLLSAGKKLINIDNVCCNVRVGDGVYKRRGGISYFKHTWNMEKYLREKKMISVFQFWKNVSIRFAGTVLCPNFVREYFFKKLMRKANKA